MRFYWTFLLIIFFVGMASSQLTIIVDEVPQNTPPNDAIHIAGDFQGWDPGSTSEQLTKDTDLGRYYITLPAGTGDINFKFTRGSWVKVEADQNGGFVPDRFYAPAEGDTIFLQILGWEDLDGNGGGTSTAADNVHVVTDSFYIPELDRYRRVWIYLPLNYTAVGPSYPVLYMHDGQNCFDALTSFIGEWEVDETLNNFHFLGDASIIVVAIDNGGSERINEYTPWSNPNYGGGDGAQYMDFIVNTLKPYIDDNYRTLPEREHTGLMGSSLGGLISLYGGIRHQDVFSKIGAFSPSYWFTDEIYNHVSTTGKQADMRIYQLMGTQEGAVHVNNMNDMEETLHAAGYGSSEIISIEKSDGQHSEWFWAREFGAAYDWLFGGGIVGVEEGHPDVIISAQLFPNPVSNKINISFYLNKAEYTHIEIMDSSGRFHKAIYGNMLQKGTHDLKLNIQSRDLVSGIYFCNIYTESVSKTMSFVVK